MSGLEARVRAKAEQDALNARYAQAKADVERNQLIENGQSGALMYMALAYGSALEQHSLLRTVSHTAKLLCIAAVFVIPNLLVIRELL